MKNITLAPFEREEVKKFEGGKGVVRLYDKIGGGWFFGTLDSLCFGENQWQLRMSPFVRANFKASIIPQDPGLTLIGDRANISIGNIRTDMQPFVLKNPQKIVIPAPVGDLTAIDFERQTIIISSRPEDMKGIRTLLSGASHQKKAT
jgi:hypothetical protein